MVNGFKIIKEKYTPIQPAVSEDNEDIEYKEVRPAQTLEHFVYCFWQLKTLKRLAQPYVYRAVSDGCIDIFFDLKQPSDNFIMGFCRKYTEFPIGQTFDYIGIRFLPTAFPLLYHVNAKSLSNRTQPLNAIVPSFSTWISTTILPSDSFEHIIVQLNKVLTDFVQQQKPKYDSRFFNSLERIFQKKGFLNVEKELQTGLSARQLRRIFNFYIGTTPKTFCQVVRFQHILKTQPSKQSLKDDKHYLDVGFFDQAHFIKDFKTFYGVTPSQAFL